MDSTVRISRALVAAILAEGAASRDEVCGLLFAPLPHDERFEVIRSIQPCRNVAADPRRRFEIDPAALIAALRAERGGGPRLLGHYHSHPSGDPRPSPTDAADAAPDGRIWLITDGRTLTAWRAVHDGAVHGRFDPLALVTSDACA